MDVNSAFYVFLIIQCYALVFRYLRRKLCSDLIFCDEALWYVEVDRYRKKSIHEKHTSITAKSKKSVPFIRFVVANVLIAIF
jgi:hypothetical protein